MTRVAAAPAREASGASRSTASSLPRRCACGQHTGGSTCGACRAGTLTAARRDTNLGEVHCSTDSGKLSLRVGREHAIGDCVRQHEQTHMADRVLIAACQGVSRCLARDDGGVDSQDLDPGVTPDVRADLCRSTYDRWSVDDEARRELPAWAQEQRCLRDVIDARCGAAEKRDTKLGAGIGAGIGGVGGGIGGGFAGESIGRSLSHGAQGAGIAGGILGVVGGAAVGAGIGALAGYLIGKAAAGSQASEGDCEAVKGQLQEVDIAVADYAKRVGTTPLPFAPDGKIEKSYVHGLMRPAATGPTRAPGAAGANGTAGMMAASRGARFAPSYAR
jgi:hypothetical protein